MFKINARGGFRFSLASVLRAWFGFNLTEFLHPLTTGDDTPATDVPMTYTEVPGKPGDVVPVFDATEATLDPMTQHILYVTGQRDRARQRVEDTRANRRNRNRMLTLFGALMIGLAVTFILNHGYLGAWGPVLAPYAFTITIALDSGLALYSYLRHY